MYISSVLRPFTHVITYPIAQAISFFRPSSDYTSTINNLFDRISQSDSVFKPNPSEVDFLKQALKQNKEKFKSLPPEQLKHILSLLLDDIHVEKSIQAILKLFNEDDLLKIAGLERSKAVDFITMQASLKEKALQSVLYTKGKALWKEVFPEIVHLFHHFMDLFVTVMGFNQIGEGQHNPFTFGVVNYEAKAKLDLYLMMLAYPSALFGFIYAYTSVASTALIISAAVACSTLAFIILYMRFLRPCPRECMGLENLSRRVLRQEEDPIYWRKDLLKKIQSAFEERKGVLFIGKTGVGKSTIVRSWAQYMHSNLSPFRKAQLFEIDIGNLNQNEQQFDLIYQRFRNHSSEAMFFIDELYALFQNQSKIKSSTVPLQLLKFQSTFRYILTATTTEEFKKFEKDPDNKAYIDAFKRRFKIIEIEPFAENQVRASLLQILQYKAPEILKENGIISYIIDKAHTFNPYTSQIDAAHALLYRAIHIAQVPSFQTLEDKIVQLESEIEEMESCVLQETDQIHPSTYLNKQEKLKKEKEQLKLKQSKLAHIKKIEALFLKNKKERYIVASKIATGSIHSSWLRLEIMKQILEQSIKHQKNELGLAPMLNQDLINQIISEETKKIASI